MVIRNVFKRFWKKIKFTADFPFFFRFRVLWTLDFLNEPMNSRIIFKIPLINEGYPKNRQFWLNFWKILSSYLFIADFLVNLSLNSKKSYLIYIRIEIFSHFLFFDKIWDLSGQKFENISQNLVFRQIFVILSKALNRVKWQKT